MFTLQCFGKPQTYTVILEKSKIAYTLLIL